MYLTLVKDSPILLTQEDSLPACQMRICSTTVLVLLLEH
jgi:hypothetical protein